MTPGQRARAARNFAIVAALAGGLSVRQVAGLFGMSASRVVQIRQSLESLARGNPRVASPATVASTRPGKAERPGRRRR